jgi:hypothetical protein
MRRLTLAETIGRSVCSVYGLSSSASNQTGTIARNNLPAADLQPNTANRLRRIKESGTNNSLLQALPAPAFTQTATALRG